MTHASHLSPSIDDVRAIALRILSRRLAQYGPRDLAVIEEVDFDGAEVLRMTSMVDRDVPASELIGVTAEIMTALRKEGDDRFVYLSSRRPGEAADIEEAEE